MTRLPVESWLVTPRLDLPPYELNTVCPVTGETSGLEDHHIWRRSFTALGEDNERLYWVEYVGECSRDTDGDGDCPVCSRHPDPLCRPTYVVKNRVALSPEAHQRITTNVARLEYRGTDLYYVEKGEEKKLDLNLHLMADGQGEKVGRCRRKPQAKTPEERKARANFTIRTPSGEEMIIPELVDQAAELLAPDRNWGDDVPSYYVVVAALYFLIQNYVPGQE